MACAALAAFSLMATARADDSELQDVLVHYLDGHG
jgi:hypothetical protein